MNWQGLVAVGFALVAAGGFWGVRDGKRTNETSYVLLFSMCTAIAGFLMVIFFLGAVGWFG